MPDRVRIILDVPRADLAEAAALADKELTRFASYSRIGWGWTLGKGGRFFVRRIKRGLSVSLARPDLEPPPDLDPAPQEPTDG